MVVAAAASNGHHERRCTAAETEVKVVASKPVPNVQDVDVDVDNSLFCIVDNLSMKYCFKLAKSEILSILVKNTSCSAARSQIVPLGNNLKTK